MKTLLFKMKANMVTVYWYPKLSRRTSGPTEELTISLGVDGVSTGHDGRQASWLIAVQVIEPFVGDIPLEHRASRLWPTISAEYEDSMSRGRD